MKRSFTTTPAWNLALATLAFMACFSAWALIAPLAKKFQDTLGLSSTSTLFLTAVPVILGSLLRIPVGMLTDRFGGRRMFTFLLGFSVVPAVLFGYAHGYWQLVGVGFLLGVAGSSFAVGVPFVASWFARERQGIALGIYGMGNIGTAIAALSAPAIVHNWGRPTLGWIAGGVLAGTAVMFSIGARDAPRRSAPANYLETFKAGWRLYRLAFFYFITFGGFVAMALLLPKLLKDWFGYSLFQAGLRAAGFSIAATLARPVGGWLADRIGAYPVLTLGFAGIAVDAAVLAALAPEPRIVPITITCLTLACFLGAGNGAVFKLVPLEFPHEAGAAAGIVGAAGGLGGFFPPIAMGIVKDHAGTYTLGFVGLLAFTGLCLALAVWLIRSATGVELRGTSAVPPALESATPAFAFDDHRRVTWWNDGAEQLLGISAAAAVGRPCWEVIAGRDDEGELLCHERCLYARAVREGRTVPETDFNVPSPGGPRRISFETITVRSQDGPVYLHLMHERSAEKLEAAP